MKKIASMYLEIMFIYIFFVYDLTERSVVISIYTLKMVLLTVAVSIVAANCVEGLVKHSLYKGEAVHCLSLRRRLISLLFVYLVFLIAFKGLEVIGSIPTTTFMLLVCAFAFSVYHILFNCAVKNIFC